MVDPEGDALVLRPAVLPRREDAWADTPEHRDLLRRAHEDFREERVRNLSEDDLAALG